MSKLAEEWGLDQAFLQAVARTMQTLDDHVTEYITKRLAKNNIHTYTALQLSRREREVFALVVQGRTNKEIASQLGISESTAKFHVSSILKKSGARSRVDVVREHRFDPTMDPAMDTAIEMIAS